MVIQDSDVKLYKKIRGVRAPNTQLSITANQVLEYQKCMADPRYFIENYVYIVNADGKKVKFKLRPYQERFLDLMINNRFVIGKLPRQVGKSVIVSIYLLHCALFKPNFSILIAANRLKTAKEIMGKVKMACQMLPMFLQKGCTEWNTASIAWENGSRISAEATTANSGRGGTNQLILLDEFAFVEENIADEFMAGVYPTIAGGSETKLFVISTPNGFNHYHKMWDDAEKGRSRFKHISIKWNDVPGRDENYRTETIANVGIDKWNQEYDCQFLGKENSLISSTILGQLHYQDPEDIVDGIKFFARPEEDRFYFITVDTSRGKGLDYSATVVFDITEYPYKIVATYKDNEVEAQFYPEKIYQMARIYNNAFILCETNDLGQQVAEILAEELEYEAMLYTDPGGRGGRVLSESGKDPGIPTSGVSRRVGCSNMKSIVEGRQLIINDWDIIEELSNFVLYKGKYQASPGLHDDLVMCLVLFSWAVNQPFFKELLDVDMRRKLFAEKAKRIEEDLIPFGSIDDGSDKPEYLPGGWQSTKKLGVY